MSTTTSKTRAVTRRRIPAVLTAAGVLIAVTACGDDGDDSAATPPVTAAPTEPVSTEQAGPRPAAAGAVDVEFAEYCALSVELDQQEGMPTAEQLTAILAVIPEEIAAAAATFVDAYVAAGDDVDPSIFAEFGEEVAVIEAFDAEHCGITSEETASPDPATVAIDPAATRVDVDATDFHFGFEPPTAAGRYSFVMTNNGDQPHVMILAQLEPGATLAEAMASEGEEGIAQSFESEPSDPGGESVVTADLTAGHWILVCPIPSAADDMQPHAALGMVHEWDVSGPQLPAARSGASVGDGTAGYRTDEPALG